MRDFHLFLLSVLAAVTSNVMAADSQPELWNPQSADDLVGKHQYLPIYREFSGMEKVKYGAASLFVPNLDKKTKVVDAYPVKALLDDPKNADAIWADLRQNKIKFLIPTSAAGIKFVPVDGKVFTSESNLSEAYKQFLTKYRRSYGDWKSGEAFADSIKTWNDANGMIYIVYSGEPSKTAKWALEKNRDKSMPYISWAYDDQPKSDQKFYFDLDKVKIEK